MEPATAFGEQRYGTLGVSQDRRGDPVPPPDELILYCGMSIGFEDFTVHEDHTGRAPLDETVMFVDSIVARLPHGENPKWQSDHS